MHRYSIILLLFVLLHTNTSAQISYSGKVVQKSFNWGFRAGANAINANYYKAYINGEEISNRDVANQVGIQGLVFGRINLGDFFVQPDIGYYLTKGKMKFGYLRQDNIDELQGVYQYAILSQKSQSLSTAMLLGYNAVKQDIYIFNAYFGPNFRFNYINKYEDKLLKNSIFRDRSKYSDLNMIAGVSANISYLYFDFRYEFYIPSRKVLNFSEISSAPDHLKDISIKKSGDILSFSIGVMF